MISVKTTEKKKPVCLGKTKSINTLVPMVKCGFRGQTGAVNKTGIHTEHSRSRTG